VKKKINAESAEIAEITGAEITGVVFVSWRLCGLCGLSV
jgi:hypothetical protein